jgi:TIR domain
VSHRVFVSYAARDRSGLEKVLEQLRKRKVLSIEDEIFVDRKSVSEGENFREVTRAAVSAADTVVVLWSPAAVESKWVNYELGMADALGKHLVIVAPRGMHPRPPIASHSFELVEMPSTLVE